MARAGRNQNPGQAGQSGMKGITTRQVVVADGNAVDHIASKLGGTQAEPGSPAGREAQPRPKVVGGNPILT